MPTLSLHLTAWSDQFVEERGYPADSGFVELFWLPVLGPSATFLFRRLNFMLETCPDGMTLNMDALGRELGLGTVQSRHAPLPRAIRPGQAIGVGPPRSAARCRTSLSASLERARPGPPGGP